MIEQDKNIAQQSETFEEKFSSLKLEIRKDKSTFRYFLVFSDIKKPEELNQVITYLLDERPENSFYTKQPYQKFFSDFMKKFPSKRLSELSDLANIYADELRNINKELAREKRIEKVDLREHYDSNKLSNLILLYKETNMIYSDLKPNEIVENIFSDKPSFNPVLFKNYSIRTSKDSLFSFGKGNDWKFIGGIFLTGPAISSIVYGISSLTSYISGIDPVFGLNEPLLIGTTAVSTVGAGVLSHTMIKGSQNIYEKTANLLQERTSKLENFYSLCKNISNSL